jgi:hypothetical protein
VPGIIYNLGLFLIRVIPRRTILFLLEKSYRKK